MKKTYKILIIILIIISLCAGLVWWQFENVRALYYWMKYSEADIDTLMSENSSEIETYLEKNPQYQVRPYSPVEEELHKKGIINDEELVSLITEQTTVEEMFGTELELSEDKKITIVHSGEQVEAESLTQMKQNAALSSDINQTENEKDISGKEDEGDRQIQNNGEKSPAQSGKNEETSKLPNKDETSEKPQNDDNKKNDQSSKPESTSKPDNKEETKAPENSEITSCIAQVYVIKSKFVGELDVIYNQAFSEYKALWRDMTDEQRKAKKKSLLSEVYPKAASLERDCDSQINQLLSKLTTLLKESGEDTGLAEQIRSSYYNEKSLKKAHYLSLLT